MMVFRNYLLSQYSTISLEGVLTDEICRHSKSIV